MHHVRPPNVNARLEFAGYRMFPAFFDGTPLPSLKSTELFREHPDAPSPSGRA